MATPPKWRRRLIRLVSRLFPGGAPLAIPVVLRWARARADALMRFRGVLRGTAIVWPYAGRAVAVAEDVARPGRGEVVVRMAISAISPGTERAYFARMPGVPGKFPFYPGYSASGEVVAVGTGVESLKRGDRVALQAAHKSLAMAKVSQIVPVPAEVSLEEAAFVQLGVIALQAVERAELQPSEQVVVIGQGMIGQLIAQITSALGHPVISVARSAQRITAPLLRAAKRVLLLDVDGINAASAIGAPVTFEVSGAPEAIPIALRCTGPGGRIILAGSTRGVTHQADFGQLADKAVSVIGAHISRLRAPTWPAMARTFLALLAAKRIDIAPLISARVHPLEAEWFYRRLARHDDATIGAVFTWDRLSQAERLRRVAIAAPPDLSSLRGWRMTVLPISKRMEVA